METPHAKETAMPRKLSYNSKGEEYTAEDQELMAAIGGVDNAKPKANQVSPEKEIKSSENRWQKVHDSDVFDDGPALSGVKSLLQAVEEGNQMRMLPVSNDFHGNISLDAFVNDALSDDKFDIEKHPDREDDGVISTKQEAIKVLKRQQIDMNELRDMELSELTAMNMTAGLSRKLLGHLDAHRNYAGKSGIQIPIRHMFMIKQISEDKDGEIWLLGTFVQNQFGSDKGFDFRINDVTCDESYIHERRATHYRNLGCRRTYNVRLPMKRSLVWADFPFQIYKVSVLVELSSRTETTPSGEECEVRPDLWLDIEDERSLVVVRDESKMDDLDTMRRFFKSPMVEMTYDTKKKYTPKYEVTFYLERRAQHKMYSLIMPLVLIAALTTFNVLMGADGPGPGLDNSISLALTMVFLMEGIESGPTLSDDDTPWYAMTDELFIIFMFLGQTLAAVIAPGAFLEGESYSLFNHYIDKDSNFTETDDEWNLPYKACNFIGVAMVWMSICFPLFNIRQRNALLKQCHGSGGVIEYSYNAKVPVKDKKTGETTMQKKNIRCDANHECMKMRVEKSTFEFHDKGVASPEKIAANEALLTKTLDAWHRAAPEKRGDFVGPLKGKARLAFVKNDIFEKDKKTGQVKLKPQKTPQKDVNMNYPKKVDAKVFVKQQQDKYGSCFPFTDSDQAEKGNDMLLQMKAEDYGDAKKYPDFDFLNLQVPVGLKSTIADEEVTVMHPRLRSVWRVHEDRGKTLHVVCGPQWGNKSNEFLTDIYDKLEWWKKKEEVVINPLKKKTQQFTFVSP